MIVIFIVSFFYIHLEQKINLNDKKAWKHKDFCSVEMTPEDTKISKLNQYQNMIKYYLLFM